MVCVQLRSIVMCVQLVVVYVRLVVMCVQLVMVRVQLVPVGVQVRMYCYNCVSNSVMSMYSIYRSFVIETRLQPCNFMALKIIVIP